MLFKKAGKAKNYINTDNLKICTVCLITSKVKTKFDTWLSIKFD